MYMDMAACQKEQIYFIRKKIKEEHIDLTGNILILCDRLLDIASELMESLRHMTNANVIGIISGYEDMNKYRQCQIDYLIVVGYLDNEKNYNIISKLRSYNDHLKTVKWAALDELITVYCRKYSICFQFDRWRPINEFIHYLINIKDDCDFRNTA